MSADDKIEKRKKERERKQRYRARHASYTISISREDVRKIARAAHEKNMTVPEYIKALITAAEHSAGYVVPKEGILKNLLVELKRSGTNLNQIVKYVNYNRQLDYRDIQAMQKILSDLHERIITALKYPPELTQLISEHLRNNPDVLPALLHWLKDYDNKNTSD